MFEFAQRTPNNKFLKDINKENFEQILQIKSVYLAPDKKIQRHKVVPFCFYFFASNQLAF